MVESGARHNELVVCVMAMCGMGMCVTAVCVTAVSGMDVMHTSMRGAAWSLKLQFFSPGSDRTTHDGQ